MMKADEPGLVWGDAMSLFENIAKKSAPLADRMRPRTIDEFFGQQHIAGKGKLLRRAIETDSLTSSIFFGPPGRKNHACLCHRKFHRRGF